MSDNKPPEICPLPKDPKLKERISKLREIFVSKYGSEPDAYFRVPGRVNLIGEHIDYCGYSVCPMAIEQDILFAVKTTVECKPFLEATNIQCEKYPDYTITNTNFLTGDKISQDDYGWVAYLLCGVRGGTQRMGRPPDSLRIAVDGNIPPGAGLSSSSALVSGAMLFTTYLNKVSLTKLELAKLSAECEQYIGTAGGGMDQAIAFCANKGSAKHIEFNPLKTTDVKLPEDAVFVVAHSLVTKEKAQSNDYNTRVVETRLAAQLLAKCEKLKQTNLTRLADVQNALHVTLDKMLALIKTTFHAEPYTKREILCGLGLTEAELNEKVLTPDTRKLEEFRLYDRALHVVSEARRVKEFLSAGCTKLLGLLMCDSHDSLQNLFEASHPQLDELVEECIEAGALGARLTGAGWGGCVVAVTTQDKVEGFLDKLKSRFYKKYYKGDNVDEVLFATKPGPGAQIYRPD